jgi:Pyruvate/2-oxoacid:ferredoxin oxidoreductase delta subunit
MIEKEFEGQHMGQENQKNRTQGVIAGADPWVHRSSGVRCRTCIWFVPKLTQGLQAMRQDTPIVGRCRRHAPSMGGYPVVYQTDWCGDHRIDENKV